MTDLSPAEPAGAHVGARPARARASNVLRLLATAFRLAAWFVWYGILRLVDPAGARAGFGPRLRVLLERSGVTAIKIGQYLAIRIDLLPLDVCRELSRLFDRVPPLPFEVVRAEVERELGGDLATRFASFDPTPIGAASIAQVHRATDRDGRRLAVKVQRPGVARTIAADFRLLHLAARLADGIALFGSISATELLDEVSRSTLREVDFLQEGRTADRLRADRKSCARIPRIHWRLTTSRVLTMDLIEGTSLAEILTAAEAGDAFAFERAAPGVPPSAIVERLAQACLRQLFVTGVFQGDPHPANVLVQRDGTVAFVDFGIFGTLTPEDRAVLRAYVRDLAFGRFEEAYYWYSLTVEATADTDLSAYRAENIRIMADWNRRAGDLSLPAGERLTAHFQGRMFAAMRRHRVRMRHDLVLFWRALAVLDSTAQRLPISFNLLDAIRRFFRQAAQEPSREALLSGLSPQRVVAAEAELAHAGRALLALAERSWAQRARSRSVGEARLRREAGGDAKRLAACVLFVAGAAAVGLQPAVGAAIMVAAAGGLILARRSATS